MTITRFDPFRDLSRFFGDVYLRNEELTSLGNWVPPDDIYETAGHDLIIKAELPDVNREDVEVTVENNTLTLKGTKYLPGDVKEEQFSRVERRYGSFAGKTAFIFPTPAGNLRASPGLVLRATAGLELRAEPGLVLTARPA